MRSPSSSLRSAESNEDIEVQPLKSLMHAQGLFHDSNEATLAVPNRPMSDAGWPPVVQLQELRFNAGKMRWTSKSRCNSLGRAVTAKRSYRLSTLSSQGSSSSSQKSCVLSMAHISSNGCKACFLASKGG